MATISAYQAMHAGRAWSIDYDGVPYVVVPRDAVSPYRFDLDQLLLDDEYITSVTWSSVGAGGMSISGIDWGTNAVGTITFTGVPAAAGTLTLNDTTITCAVAPTGVDEFAPGATTAEAATNLANCVNNGSEHANVLAVADGATVEVSWLEYGTVGNETVFAESLTNCTADGSGYLGGTQAGSTVGGVDGKSHVVTVSGYGDAIATVVTTRQTMTARYRWRLSHNA
jgi:hypothetical protein